MLPLAFELFGIPEFWTGALVTFAVIAAGVWLALFGDEITWPWRWGRDRNDEADYYGRSRRMTRGVVICDWVDTSVLTTVAKQKQIEPDPDRMELGEATATSGGVEGGGKRFRGRAGRERKRDERAFYELTKDPNALLVKVLGKLQDDGGIEDDLDHVFVPGFLHGEMLDNIIEVARGKPQLEAAREAVQSLQASAVQDRKAKQWQDRAGSPSFALVESEWRVSRVIDATGGETTTYLELRLLKLRQPVETHGYGVYDVPMQELDMPDDLALEVQLPLDGLTEQGKARLKDNATVTAGVFGTTADFQHGTLHLTPIAVFARVE